jgi:hypothetical protein
MRPCLTGAYKLRHWRPVYGEIGCGPYTGDRIETFASVPSLLQAPSLIPGSAVAVDRKREAQSLRSEVDGFLPLSRDRSAVLRAGCLRLIATTCESAKPL